MAESTSELEPRTRLLGGVNFPTWPDLKWARANAHVLSLRASLVEWNMSVPISIKSKLRDDSQHIDFIAAVPRGVPKYDWALDAGDAIHNLRSALDAAAWGIAHFDGAQPRQPKQVTFPMCAEEKDWARALRGWLRDVPADLRSRIEAVQPFHAPPQQAHPLALIHEFDIVDKHRDNISVRAEIQGFEIGGAFEYDDRIDAAGASLELRMNPDAELIDGAHIGQVDAGARIRMLHEVFLRPDVALQIEYRGVQHNALELLSDLVAQVRTCLDGLMNGFEPPTSRGEPQDLKISGWGSGSHAA